MEDKAREYLKKARAYERIHTLMEPDDMVEEIYNSRETIEELENKMSIANDKLKKIEEYIYNHQLFGMRYGKTLYRESLINILKIIKGDK